MEKQYHLARDEERQTETKTLKDRFKGDRNRLKHKRKRQLLKERRQRKREAIGKEKGRFCLNENT